MTTTAKKTDPKLWDKVKTHVTDSDKGGEHGRWSARKAQLATQEYKEEGGGYEGAKPSDNHLAQWTREDWGTKSGAESGQTVERYLPRQAREHLSGPTTSGPPTRSDQIRRKASSSRRSRPISRRGLRGTAGLETARRMSTC